MVVDGLDMFGKHADFPIFNCSCRRLAFLVAQYDACSLLKVCTPVRYGPCHNNNNPGLNGG